MWLVISIFIIILIITIIIIILLLASFHPIMNWRSFTEVWMIASLLMFLGLY